jgi:hypothetical protein
VDPLLPYRPGDKDSWQPYWEHIDAAGKLVWKIGYESVLLDVIADANVRQAAEDIYRLHFFDFQKATDRPGPQADLTPIHERLASFHDRLINAARVDLGMDQRKAKLTEFLYDIRRHVRGTPVTGDVQEQVR